MEKDEVIRKIRALLRFTPDNSTPAEAANAARIARAMLQKYQLSLEAVHEIGHIHQKEAWDGDVIPTYVKALASAIATPFECLAIIRAWPRRGITFIGQPSDVEVAAYFFESLLRQLQMEAENRWTQEHVPQRKKAGYMNSFISAAAREISQRLRQTSPTPAAGPIDIATVKKQTLKQWVKDQGIRQARRVKLTTTKGIEAGREYGKTIPLRRGVTDSDDPLQLP